MIFLNNPEDETSLFTRIPGDAAFKQIKNETGSLVVPGRLRRLSQKMAACISIPIVKMTPEQRIKAYGSADPLPAQVRLKAGELDVVYENGSLRLIRLGNIEILRRIYSAVRDRNWETIEPHIESESLKIDKKSFEISLKLRYQSGSIHFFAEYHISGKNNRIRFEMLGKAQTDFLKNRIGFCVLHPISECSGKYGKVIHPDGNTTDFIFPEMISAHQPAGNIQKLIWSPASGVTSTLNFSGDIFEMEDQRNWTDASFKTYCTPLGLPFPAKMKKGETVYQVVELIVKNDLIISENSNEFVFSVYPDRLSSLPELGTAMSSRKESLTQYELDLLTGLSLKHLRIEVKPGKPGFRINFKKAARESHLFGWPLFVVLYLSNDYQNEYHLFAKLCKEFCADVMYLLPVGQDHLAFTKINELEFQIRDDFPGIKLGTGVNAYFAELNRNRPAIKNADFVNFTICPQVHAFDILSIVENLEAQADVIKSARGFSRRNPSLCLR